MVDSSELILFVDDQSEIVELIKRHVGGTYDCIYAASGAEALNLLDARGPFAVIVADYSMPNMDGITLLAEVRKRAPDTVLIMLTAYGDIDVAITALHQGHIFRFLRKPWDRAELEHALADALDHYHLVINERRLRDQLATANASLDAKVKELDEINQLLEYWVEFGPAVLYSVDCAAAELTLTYVSKNFFSLTGHERTAMIVEPSFWESLLFPEDVQKRREALIAFINGRSGALTLSYRVRHKNGTYRQILDAIRAIRNPQGKALELVGSWIDVSKNAEGMI